MDIPEGDGVPIFHYESEESVDDHACSGTFDALGKLHGKGRKVYDDYKDEGYFDHGEILNGSRVWIDGTVFVGDFELRFRGKGVLTFVNGDTFDGAFVFKHIPMGYGTLRKEDGTYLYGNFVFSGLDGKVLVWTDDVEPHVDMYDKGELIGRYIGDDVEDENDYPLSLPAGCLALAFFTSFVGIMNWWWAAGKNKVVEKESM